MTIEDANTFQTIVLRFYNLKMLILVFNVQGANITKVLHDQVFSISKCLSYS